METKELADLSESKGNKWLESWNLIENSLNSADTNQKGSEVFKLDVRKTES